MLQITDHKLEYASCVDETAGVTIDDIEITNPSIMTGCIGYSLYNQPTAWYIKNDTCFADGSDNSQIAAIGICCTLIDLEIEPSTDTGICEITDTSFSAIITNACVISAIVFVVLGIWIAFTIFCIITQRNNKQEKERQEKWVIWKLKIIAVVKRN